MCGIFLSIIFMCVCICTDYGFIAKIKGNLKVLFIAKSFNIKDEIYGQKEVFYIH